MKHTDNDDVKGEGAMAIQITQKSLEYYVLTYLSMNESYGAQMFENIAEGINVSITALYNVINELAESGKILKTQAVQNGRACQLCSITPAGKRYLKKFLKQ